MPKKNDTTSLQSDPEQEPKQKGTFAETAPDNIPQVEAPTGLGGSRTPDLEDFEGLYLRKGDNEKYALAIDETNQMGRTHKATNTLHYWEGTGAQFRAQFTNEDGSEIREDKASKKKSDK